MTPPTIRIEAFHRDGTRHWRICYGSTCRETQDYWQIYVWSHQFLNLMTGQPEG